MQRSDLDPGKPLSTIRFRNLRERAIIGVNLGPGTAARQAGEGKEEHPAPPTEWRQPAGMGVGRSARDRSTRLG